MKRLSHAVFFLSSRRGASFWAEPRLFTEQTKKMRYRVQVRATTSGHVKRLLVLSEKPREQVLYESEYEYEDESIASGYYWRGTGWSGRRGAFAEEGRDAHRF